MIQQLTSFLSELDNNILLAINGAHTPFLDTAMWTISGKWIWIPLYVFILFAVFKHKDRRRAILFLFAVTLCIMLADFTCGQLLRNAVGRMRPSNPDNPISSMIHLVNGYHGGRYGFPSCHAANSFGLAVMMMLYFRLRIVTAIMMIWMALQCYSRMYLGVHYPTDILVGILIGGSFAVFSYNATFNWAKSARPRYSRINRRYSVYNKLAATG